MNRRSFILGAGAGALTAVSNRAAAAVTMADVLPFAGADHVRIEVRVHSDAAVAGLELAGRIEPWAGGPALWAGAVGQVDAPAGGTATVTKKVAGLRPRLWDLHDPQLYRLTATARHAGAIVAEKATRLGFRSFASREGRFWLNGRPIYLRGNSINPPGRGVPEAVGMILSNEAPHRGPAGEAFGRFFEAVHAVLREWDPNRLYIGNAGFGAGRGGDINDAHPYWGWYGGDFLTNYARLQDRGSGRQAGQPWTFTECVGAYTTPEGRFSVGGGCSGRSATAAPPMATLSIRFPTRPTDRDGSSYVCRQRGGRCSRRWRIQKSRTTLCR